jgi:pullulanase/glycogen debranching enzyme
MFFGRGVPMLLAGDEILRTQHGNNNAWCQDNELSWFDWSLVDTERDMLEFVRGMIALRRRHSSLVRNAFFTGKSIPGRNIPDVAWHGIRLNKQRGTTARHSSSPSPSLVSLRTKETFMGCSTWPMWELMHRSHQRRTETGIRSSILLTAWPPAYSHKKINARF